MAHTSTEGLIAAISNCSVSVLEGSALQAASPIVLALEECDDELRAEAINLFKQLDSGNLDEDERRSTLALLAEILFPSSDDNGLPGLDLVEAEEIAKSQDPEAKTILDQMDEEEATFAERLRDVMDRKNMSQTVLSEKIGIGQSAISMMLQRNCRPQNRTIIRMAEALSVSPQELWPSIKLAK